MITAVLRALLFWGIEVITDPEKKEKGFGLIAGACLFLVVTGLLMTIGSREPQLAYLISGIALGTYVVTGGIRRAVHILGPRIPPTFDNAPHRTRLEELLGVTKR